MRSVWVNRVARRACGGLLLGAKSARWNVWDGSDRMVGCPLTAMRELRRCLVDRVNKALRP